MPHAVWPPAAKQRAYELRAQGDTIHEIADKLAQEFDHSPSYITVYRWLASDEAKPLIAAATERVKAIWVTRTLDTVGNVYDGLEEAVAARDAKAVDSWSRAIVALTRGFVADRVELEPPKAVGGDAELRSLLAAHGVNLASTDNPESSTPQRNIS